MENISLPAMAKAETIRKATITDLSAIILRVVESQVWVMNHTGKFGGGFV